VGRKGLFGLNVYPLVERPTPLLDLLLGEKVGVTPATLTEAQRRLMEKFREGIAEALGVPPEAIREEPLQTWVIQWTKAWVRPEYWASLNWDRMYENAYSLGKALGEAVKEAKG